MIIMIISNSHSVCLHWLNVHVYVTLSIFLLNEGQFIMYAVVSSGEGINMYISSM